MILNYREYVSRFKDLIANGYIVVRDGKTSVYWWVNPHAPRPTKMYFREAYEELYYDLILTERRTTPMA